MKRYKKFTVAGLSVVIVLIGLKLIVTAMPVRLDYTTWNDMVKCAENQRNIYQSIEHFQQENGKLLKRNSHSGDWKPNTNWKCPACENGFTLNLENYGNPSAVVIADRRDRHPGTLMWWFRGLSPRVQTMGDGKIHFFKGGKVLTMNGSRKQK